MTLLRRLGVAVGWALTLAACAGETTELSRRRALTAEMEGRYDLARRFWGEVVRAEPDDLSAQRSEAIAWLRGTQISTSEGLARLDRYLARRPDDSIARREGVEARLLTGRWQAATSEAAFLPDSEAEKHALRARALMALDAKAARAAIERALVLEPGLPYNHLLAAEIAYELGDLGAVDAHAERALAAGATRLKAAYLLGRSALLRGEKKGAAHWLEVHRLLRAVTGEGSSAPPPARLGLTLLAQLRALLGFAARDLDLTRVRWEFAADNLVVAETLTRELAPALSAAELAELGSAAYRARRVRLARELFERAQGLQAFDPGPVTSLALLDLDEGSPESARARLEAFLAARPEAEPCARCEVVLARAEQRMGEEVAALEHLRRAVNWAPWKRDWVEELALRLDLVGKDGERSRILAGLARFEGTSPQ